MRYFVVLFLLGIFIPASNGATGGKSSASRASTPVAGSSISAGSVSRGGGGGGSARRLDPRNVPPLAEDRKISVQDCGKPVDWTAGNLKCK